MPSEPWPLYQGKWGKRRRRKKKLMYSSTTAFNAQSTMTITSRQMGKKEEEEEEDEEADVLNSGYHKNLRFYSHAIRPLDCDGLHSGCLMTCYQFATDYFLPPPPHHRNNTCMGWLAMFPYLLFLHWKMWQIKVCHDGKFLSLPVTVTEKKKKKKCSKTTAGAAQTLCIVS